MGKSKSISGCSRYGSDSSYPKDRSSRRWVASTVLDGSLLFARGAMSRDRAGWMYCVSSSFAFNSLMILIVVFEATHTRFWLRLGKFDYLDIKSVVIASSAGGGKIAKTVLNEHYAKGTDWVADPSDPIAGAVRVKWDLSSTLDDIETMAIVEARDRRAVPPRRVRKKRSMESMKLVGVESSPENPSLFRS